MSKKFYSLNNTSTCAEYGRFNSLAELVQFAKDKELDSTECYVIKSARHVSILNPSKYTVTTYEYEEDMPIIETQYTEWKTFTNYNYIWFYISCLVRSFLHLFS